MNIGYETEFYGLLGVFANAFLSGAFDDIDWGNQWYDHPGLSRRMQFRGEATLQREADWPAEWLALLRMEGATQLRFHTQSYKSIQQHLALATPQGARAPVLSAWDTGQFGSRCLSSWTPSFAPSVSRAKQQESLNSFSYPIGMPADLVVEEMLRTERLLDAAAGCAVDTGRLLQRVDSLYAQGKQGGYVLDAFPAHSGERVAWALERLGATAQVDDYHPHPVFPSDARADVVREIYLDMALLYGQLAQVPERTPTHPYDDVNRGHIFPSADASGQVYEAMGNGLRAIEYEWLELCYRPWSGKTSLQPDLRLNQRRPVDLTYSMYEHKKLLTRTQPDE